MATTFRKPVDDDIPWEQRLVNYASNRDAGKNEYQRAMEKYRAQSAIGDTANAENSKRWADQVDTAIGGIGSNRSSQINDYTNTLGQKVSSQPFEFKNNKGPFQYDANSDQAYQAALRQAQAGAKTATNNAMVGLGSRGIGNSSVAVDRANQIQQQAIGNVNDTVLPQLISQAYTRYQDDVNNDYRQQLANYQASQDQIGNMSNYIGTLNGLEQQDFENTRQSKLDNLNASQIVGQQSGRILKPTVDWGAPLYDQIDTAPLNLQGQGQAFGQQMDTDKFNYGKEQDAADRKFREEEAIRSAQQFAASQGLQWANLSQRDKEFLANQEMQKSELAWQKDPSNPDNIYKAAQTSKALNPEEQPKSYKENPDFQQDVSFLVANPKTSMQTLRENAAKFIEKYGLDGYKELISLAQK